MMAAAFRCQRHAWILTRGCEPVAGLGRILVGVHVLVCQAIAQRKVIRFHYDGGTRDIEPHVHGVGKDGGELLRGYQVSGFSRSGR